MFRDSAFETGAEGRFATVCVDSSSFKVAASTSACVVGFVAAILGEPTISTAALAIALVSEIGIWAGCSFGRVARLMVAATAIAELAANHADGSAVLCLI